MKKYCVKCGHEFEAVGREVICPDCKAAAAEDAKRAAVLKAKKASWTGESVPVRISGRASAVIRHYGAANGMPFAAALDDLLKASDYFKSTGVKWENVEPYKSHRRDKHATETAQDTASKPQEVKQDGTQATSKPQEVPQEVKAASKPQDTQEVKRDKPVKPVKQAAKKAVKTAAGK